MCTACNEKTAQHCSSVCRNFTVIAAGDLGGFNIGLDAFLAILSWPRTCELFGSISLLATFTSATPQLAQ